MNNNLRLYLLDYLSETDKEVILNGFDNMLDEDITNYFLNNCDFERFKTVVKYLKKNYKEVHLQTENIIKYNRVDILDYLYFSKERSWGDRMLDLNKGKVSNELLDYCVKYNKLDIIAKLKEKIRYYDPSYLYCSSAKYNNIGMLDWLNNHGISIQNELFLIAVQNNNVDVLKWARDHNYRLSEDILSYAIKYNSLDTLKWLLSLNSTEEKYVCTIENYQNAITFGNFEMVKWLKNVKKIWSDDTCAIAAKKGHLKIFKWSVEYANIFKLCEAFDNALAYGMFNIVKEFINPSTGNSPLLDIKIMKDSLKNNIDTMRDRKIETIKYIDILSMPYDCASEFEYAARYGHLQSLKFLKKNHNDYFINNKDHIINISYTFINHTTISWLIHDAFI